MGTAVETFLSGGTSVVDHLGLIPGKELETIARAVSAYKDIGIRAFVAPLIQDESLTAGIPSGEFERTHLPYFRITTATLELIEEAVRQFNSPDEGYQYFSCSHRDSALF